MSSVTCFDQQYNLVQSSRKILLDYCATISEKDFTKQHSGFGYSSIRDLLVHITNCYRAWLSRALKRPFEKTEFDTIHTIKDIRILFEKVDEIMQDFFLFIQDVEPGILAVTRGEETLHLPPLTLFSHVITHEFHHKGQILSLSRQWGYVPKDTDIIR